MLRVKLDDVVMHVLARRSQTYASNSHIFLVWMLGTSLVLWGGELLRMTRRSGEQPA